MASDYLNIVVIVADTFRRDHLGCYGNPWIQTPHLDHLAERALVFDRCYAASFPTIPARIDLLTGNYSFTMHGWGPLPVSEHSLPQLLQDQAGYKTMCIADTPFYIRNGYGYDRGFSDFIWIRGQRFGDEYSYVTQSWRSEEDLFAPQTMKAAEKWLEKNYREKFFLLLDTWDPHEPWSSPDYYVEKYHKNYNGQPSPYPCYADWKEAGRTEGDLKLGHACYCGEVTMVDRWIGRVLERLESLDLMDKTAIFFISDHGFYFGEHGLYGKAVMRAKDAGYLIGPSHAGGMGKDKVTMQFRSPQTGEIKQSVSQWWRSPLYDEVTRIPLLVYLPQIENKRIEAAVTLPDLAPTILQLAELEVPEVVQAPSLMPLILGEKECVHDLVITSWPLYNPGQSIRVVDDWNRRVVQPLPSTITCGEWTLLYAMEGEPIELYHRPSDPAQKNNVYSQNSGIAGEIHGKFVEFLEKFGTDEALLKPRRKFP